MPEIKDKLVTAESLKNAFDELNNKSYEKLDVTYNKSNNTLVFQNSPELQKKVYVDKTLTKSNNAADAKVVGDKLTEVNTEITALKKSVSDGKELVATAITGQGVATESTDTFATMAENIGKIESGGGIDKDLRTVKFIDNENNPVVNLSVNMSICAAAFYLLSSVTSGIYVGRIPIYMSLYSYISLPWLLKNIFTDKSMKIMYVFTIVLYLLFFYYQMFVIW